MPDVAGRSSWEMRLRQAVAGLQPGQLQRLMAELRAQADFEHTQIPDELFEQFDAEMRAALEPVLVQIFIESAREAATAYPPLTISWELVNQRAVDWAAGYAFDLVSQIDATTRDGLQAAISNYFQTSATMGDLRAQIAQFIPTIQDKLGRTLFAATRAQMIATTEVTRASVQGELAWRAQVRAENPGIKMTTRFQTNVDELVCPICSPLNGKSVTPRFYPPRHPRCRCWLNHELVGTFN